VSAKAAAMLASASAAALGLAIVAARAGTGLSFIREISFISRFTGYG
jgi:hypothetical protein